MMKHLIFLISAFLLLQLVSARFVEEELEEEERKDLEKKRIPTRWVKPAWKYASKWGKEAIKQGLQSEAYNYAKDKVKQGYNWSKNKARQGADWARRTWGRKRDIDGLDELDDMELEEFFESQLQ